MLPYTKKPSHSPRPCQPVAPWWVFFGLTAIVVAEYLGLASRIPVLKAMRATTLVSAVLTLATLSRKEGRYSVRFLEGRLLLALVVMTAMSVLYAYVQTYALDAISPQAGYFGLFLVVAYAIDRPRRVDGLAVVLSLIVTVLVIQNLGELTSGSRQGRYTAGYFLGDGNDFAWGIATLLPLALHLLLRRGSVVLRFIGLAGVLCGVLGVVGTQSRGATLALLAVAVYCSLTLARRKIRTLLLLTAAVAVMILVAPSAYLDRMRTIEAYQTDNSATVRLNAWRAATKMALDHPLGVGAGNFNSAYGRFYNVTVDSDIWGSGRWISPHSIYFRALGEYGFPGLVILLSLLWRSHRRNRDVMRKMSAEPVVGLSEHWPGLLNASVIGYAVGGAFLGGMNYPHLFLLAGLTVSGARLADAASAEAKRSGGSGHDVCVAIRRLGVTV